MKSMISTLKMMPLLLMLAVILLLSGCSRSLYSLKPDEEMQAFSRNYSQFDMKLAWDLKGDNAGMSVVGLVRNLRWAYAQDFELSVSLLDANGRVVAKGVGFPAAGVLEKDQNSSFAVNLAGAKPQKGERLLFSYKYYGVETAQAPVFWTQSFESTL